MLVKYADRKLGELNSVEMDWVGSAADSEGLAVVMHVFHALTGKIPQFLNDKITEVEAGSMERRNDFPEIGKVKTVVCGHPEPITIPKYIKVKNAREAFRQTGPDFNKLQKGETVKADPQN